MMIPTPTRTRKVLCFLLVTALSGLLPALAAGATLSGSVEAEGLPPGSAVRASRTAGEATETRFAPVGEDGAFQFSEMEPGEWTLDVIGPDGQSMDPVSGAPTTVSVPGGGAVEVSLAVVVPPAMAVQKKKGGGVAPWVAWTTAGVIVGAAIILISTTGGGDGECVGVSPDAPCI
ncbi:MAG: hypothetical protein PVF68_13100 [Acidobacteriota bacterium]|jgi:hypothetical protein